MASSAMLMGVAPEKVATAMARLWCVQGTRCLIELDDDSGYWRCPISCERMRVPVVADDGWAYEEKEIKRWFESRCRVDTTPTSPLTNLTLENTGLCPLLPLRDAFNTVLSQPEYLRLRSEQQNEAFEAFLRLHHLETPIVASDKLLKPPSAGRQSASSSTPGCQSASSSARRHVRVQAHEADGATVIDFMRAASADIPVTARVGSKKGKRANKSQSRVVPDRKNDMLLCNVFASCSVQDLLCSASVCSRWNRILATNDVVWTVSVSEFCCGWVKAAYLRTNEKGLWRSLARTLKLNGSYNEITEYLSDVIIEHPNSVPLTGPMLARGNKLTGLRFPPAAGWLASPSVDERRMVAQIWENWQALNRMQEAPVFGMSAFCSITCSYVASVRHPLLARAVAAYRKEYADCCETKFSVWRAMSQETLQQLLRRGFPGCTPFTSMSETATMEFTVQCIARSPPPHGFRNMAFHPNPAYALTYSPVGANILLLCDVVQRTDGNRIFANPSRGPSFGSSKLHWVIAEHVAAVFPRLVVCPDRTLIQEDWRKGWRLAD